MHAQIEYIITTMILEIAEENGVLPVSVMQWRTKKQMTGEKKLVPDS